MSKWQCGVCGYIFDGDEAPANCPKCGAPKEKFQQLDDETASKVDRSRYTNGLHMELFALLEKAKEISENGIKDALDPACVQIFETTKACATDIQQRIKAELKTHMTKNKWG